MKEPKSVHQEICDSFHKIQWKGKENKWEETQKSGAWEAPNRIDTVISDKTKQLAQVINMESSIALLCTTRMPEKISDLQEENQNGV